MISLKASKEDGTEGVADDGYVTIPRRWSFIFLGGAISYLAAAIFAATMIYARVGGLEEKSAATDRLIDSRHQTGERRWEDLHRMNERVVRVETQINGMTNVLERIERKFDATDLLRIPR